MYKLVWRQGIGSYTTTSLSLFRIGLVNEKAGKHLKLFNTNNIFTSHQTELGTITPG